ncbi:MAG TPA: asparagine synthase-related protein, partial [Candidatus Krumholzibacteria bacterium]|nr:asparagine synthase-related protein [Candidatus Krumholzibacteria bacterium]
SDRADAAANVAASARTLLHLDSLTMQSGTVDGVGLAQVWRDRARPDRDWFDDEALAVRVAGHVLLDGPSPRRLVARDLAETYRATGKVPAADYDGAFMIVVVDRARRRVVVANDRVGAFPIYLARHDHAFAFGPEAKSVLAAAGLRARLRPDGVAGLLTFGYCLGATTLFEGVAHLEPASILTLDVASLAHRIERYWNLRFEPSRALRRRSHAENALYETLLASQRLVLCDQPASYEVMLSGGLDSRGVVAFANVLGKLPSRTFTWGASDAVPKSDAFVARRVAEHFRVPHRFLSYDSGEFVANARDWVYVSELANDNVGWFAEGQPTLAKVYRSGADFAIAGDVVWDSGGFAFSDMEMRRAVLPPALPVPLAACLTPDAGAEYRRLYDHEIAQVLARCDHRDLTDRKEYLYLYARVARYILSLGYYREHAIEVRRPFLSKAALELFASLPRNHRVEKNAYASMLHHRFPELMAIPEQSVWSLPDWERDVRRPGAVRDLWMHYTERERVASGPLAGVLDGDAFAARRDTFFAAVPPPAAKPPLKARFPLRARVLPFVQRHRAIDKLSRLVRVGPGFLPRSDFDLVRCVVLVSMLDESLDRFSSPASR